MKLWVGQTISQVGSTVTREALPLTAALALGATPLQMGLLAAVSAVPVLLIGLVAGVWVDRLRRRPVMIGADLGRAVLLLAIPIAAALGALRIEHLFLILPLVGILTVFFDTAYQSFVPSVVRREEIVEANSTLGIGAAGAEVTAPGLAGVLVQTIGGPGTVLLDAASFLCSAVLVWLMQTPERAGGALDERSGMGREIAEGLRAIGGNGLLRAFAGCAVASNFFGGFFAALYTLYAIRVLGMGPALLGVTVAFGGAGGLLGAFLTGPITGRFGIGATIVGAYAIGGVFAVLIPLAGGGQLAAAAVLMGAQLFGDAAFTVFEISALSLRQTIVEDRLLGRVNASMNLLGGGVGPLGALAGGVLGGTIGIRQTLAVAVAGSMTGLLWLFFSPVRTYGAAQTGEPA